MLRAVDIIIKKRDGDVLTREEIEFFIHGFTSGEILDYQASAWAMAVLLNGMTRQEATDLTMAMAHSGRTIDLSTVVPFAVDKHSTGGVGDKNTLIVEPIVAACGLPVGKMSGRGLGFTGGTIDKIESIPGLRTDLSIEEFTRQLKSVGLVLTGQSDDLAPADGKLYALRDVTGTVNSLPLIAASIMSKKIASGAQGIVLDVKWGLGAFMSTVSEATKLAELMVNIASLAKRKAVALITDMNQPLGYAVGNALELEEAIKMLNGEGPQDLRANSLELASEMLILGGIAPDKPSARLLAEGVITNGSALEKLKILVEAQGGDSAYVSNPGKLPKSRHVVNVYSSGAGWLKKVHARIIGETACYLGAGRDKKGDPVDHAVGVKVFRKVGDLVKEGDLIGEIHANDESKIELGKRQLLESHEFSQEPVQALPIFSGVIRA